MLKCDHKNKMDLMRDLVNTDLAKELLNLRGLYMCEELFDFIPGGVRLAKAVINKSFRDLHWNPRTYLMVMEVFKKLEDGSIPQRPSNVFRFLGTTESSTYEEYIAWCWANHERALSPVDARRELCGYAKYPLWIRPNVKFFLDNNTWWSQGDKPLMSLVYINYANVCAAYVGREEFDECLHSRYAMRRIGGVLCALDLGFEPHRELTPLDEPKDWRKSSVDDFIRETCPPGSKVRRHALEEQYDSWCETNNRHRAKLHKRLQCDTNYYYTELRQSQ